MDIGNLGSAYDDIYSQAVSQSSSKLESQLKADYSQATDDELMDVCKQFEAYFLEQVLKGVMKTVPEPESSSQANSNLVSYFKDEMVKELASQSTEQNGLGLAQMLYEQMRRNYGLDPNCITAAELAARKAAEQVGAGQTVQDVED
ncbi:MAG: rod-binding protein [Acetatifactor sp.]|nr:rod-binding protein [Acetatifactor sp.]